VLRYTIGKVVGDKVKLINPAFETAQAIKDILIKEDILNKELKFGKCEYFCSDDPQRFHTVGSKIVPNKILEVKKVNISTI
ncbi:MAG: glutamate racemase, partial [Tissierellia bacterium]|nr:glutamate racemase [Tissierellia bacterium]